MTGYDVDILKWSEHRAALLHCAVAGERVNDLDWPNISDVLPRSRSRLSDKSKHHFEDDPLGGFASLGGSGA